MIDWQDISRQIEKASGRPFQFTRCARLSGGDINSAYRLEGLRQTYFVKLNRADLFSMFAAEAAGLEELAACGTMRVPRPIAAGAAGDYAFLALDYLELSASGRATARLLGEQLARLHRVPQPFFGWHRHNTIGSTPQLNDKHENWPDFWRTQRLSFQLQLATKNGYQGKLQTLGERLLAVTEQFFAGYRPMPSLLHGDLWSGNAAADKSGHPVLYDPACYYGDRETDMAMTELFGGFDADFYAAYQAGFPLDADYRVRKTLYNLYHVLNHLNLFGGGYLRQAENMMARLLAETA